MKKRFISVILTVCMVLALLPGTAKADTGIVSGTLFNGHRYQLVEAAMTWREAKAYCESMGGYLACITSAEEQNFIESLIASGSKYQYWLGGYRTQGGGFAWVSGEAFSYANWDRIEPNNHQNNEAYVQIYRKPNPAVPGSMENHWNDISENNTIVGEEDFFSLEYTGFICEWDLTWVEYAGHRYQLVEAAMTWQEAKAYCQSMGGYLACITSAGEQGFIESLVAAGNSPYYWIGATDEEAEGVWEWLSGEEFTFENWGNNQPDNNYGDGDGEDYASISRIGKSWASAGEWNDFTNTGSTSRLGGLICEWGTPAGGGQAEGEYIYDTHNPGGDIVLPVELLDNVTDASSASSAVSSLTTAMTAGEKVSATGVDLATLYAETAAAKASSQAVDGDNILINAALLSKLEPTAIEASEAVEKALTDGGVTTARYLSKTVILATDETSVSVRIDPDVLNTSVDKVRVETPSYAITFKLSDLAPDLTHVLTFTAEAVNPMARTASNAVSIALPEGGTTNSVTVSLPSDSDDPTYQTVATTDGTATASKYNPATTNMDGKINQSGTYTVITNEKDFTDIGDKSQEMQEAIRYLASKGIIGGRTATTFDPDGSITRAEIATLLVKALGKLDPSATTNFSDVKPSNWYYSAAASSQKHGLINGFGDNTFRGTTDINKVQIVVVSSRVLTTEMKYKTPNDPSTYLSRYSDSVSKWAQPEVALATRENLVVYRTDGTFSGDKNMTRGDAAIIIYRLFQRIW